MPDDLGDQLPADADCDRVEGDGDDLNMRTAAILSILLLACAPQQKTGSDEQRDVTRPSFGVLHLKVTHTSAYCGGADPGPEGMPRPEPWQGPMYLRHAVPDSSGRMAHNDLGVPITDTIRTDRTGHGHLTLPAGNYLLLDDDRVDDQRYKRLLKDHAQRAMYTEPIDKECLERWLHGPFGVITIVGGDTNHVDLPLFEQCPWYSTPCVRYNGPLPP